jgi:membrane carboxypeptidase/penicillin-binding protein PbpC
VGNNDNTPMTDVDGITGAGPIWHYLVEAAIKQGYVKRNKITPPEGLQQVRKCLNTDCSQAELIYEEPGRQWYSDLDTGHFCLEDFFIKTIDAAENQKMAKLFHFKDFSINWCLPAEQAGAPSGADEGTRRDVRSYVSTAGDNTAAGALEILSPSPNETFYLRRDIPVELQQIILRANQEAEWFMDRDRVGYGKNIFIQPMIGKHIILARQNEKEDAVSIEILQID